MVGAGVKLKYFSNNEAGWCKVRNNVDEIAPVNHFNEHKNLKQKSDFHTTIK